LLQSSPLYSQKEVKTYYDPAKKQLQEQFFVSADNQSIEGKYKKFFPNGKIYIVITKSTSDEAEISIIDNGPCRDDNQSSSIKDSYEWRENFKETFLERDIPNLGINIPARTLRQFWTMLSHYHGQVFNASELARSMNLSSPTIQRYLDILSYICIKIYILKN
jgi:hypothetical protein